MNIIIIEPSGLFEGSFVAHSSLPFEELKKLKEHNGRKVYEISENDLDKMFNGFDIIIDNEKVKVMNEKRNDLIEKLKRG